MIRLVLLIISLMFIFITTGTNVFIVKLLTFISAFISISYSLAIDKVVRR